MPHQQILIPHLFLSMSPRTTHALRQKHAHTRGHHTTHIPSQSGETHPESKWGHSPAISSPSNHYYPLALGRRELNNHTLLKGIVRVQFIRSLHYHHPPVGAVWGRIMAWGLPEVEFMVLLCWGVFLLLLLEVDPLAHVDALLHFFFIYLFYTMKASRHSSHLISSLTLSGCKSVFMGRRGCKWCMNMKS